MRTTVNVVLIEASDADAEFIKTTLRESTHRYRIIHATSLERASKLLHNDKTTDVILCNVALPDADALKTFQRLKRIAVNLPVVFLAAAADEELALSALQKGAEDYLLLGDIDSATLVRSIRYAIERKSYQHQAEAAKSRSRALRLHAQMLKEKSAHLQALSEAKDDFIALASHQLRTPATGVRQYISMLREGYFGEMNDSQRQMLDVALESSERQLRIVDDLLKVARVDSGYFELKRSHTDLVSVVREVISEHTQQIELKNQLLEFKTTRPEIIANIDAAQIRIVLENLLDNAHKYTPAGKRIIVSIGYKLGKAIIDVKDEGVGISKPDLAKLFEKFRRIINPHNETYSGSGLGLYWAKRIVDLHGGSLEAFSTEGKGSIFSVSLEA